MGSYENCGSVRAMQHNLSILGFYKGPIDNISSIGFYYSLIAFGVSAGVPVPKAQYLPGNIAAPSSPMTTTLCQALHNAALAAMSAGGQAPSSTGLRTISSVTRTAASPVLSILNRASALISDDSSSGLVSAGTRTSAGSQPAPLPTPRPPIDRGLLEPMPRLPVDDGPPDPGGEEILYTDELPATPAEEQKIPTWAWAAGAGLLLVIALIAAKKASE